MSMDLIILIVWTVIIYGIHRYRHLHYGSRALKSSSKGAERCIMTTYSGLTILSSISALWSAASVTIKSSGCLTYKLRLSKS